MKHRNRYTEHAPRRSDPQGSLARHGGGAPLTDGELRALVARAHRLGVIVFLKADLERMPALQRTVIEGAARQLYEHR